MTHYCVRVVMWDTNLNTLRYLFMHRLRVCNTVQFSASASTASARVFHVPAGSTHYIWIPRSWIFFFLYVNKYCVRRHYAPPGGVLCDSHQDFSRLIPNKIEIFLVIMIVQKIKTHVHRFGAFLNNSSVDNSFWCGIFGVCGCFYLWVEHFL